jgi:AraC-like DNA-binding protein
MGEVPIYKIGNDDHTHYVEVVELRERNSYDASKPHKHEYLELFVFTNGAGFHEIDFKDYPIESVSVHFVFPNQTHKVKRELNTNGHVILMSKEYFSDADYDLYVQFFHSFYLEPTLLLDPKVFNRVLDIIQDVKHELIAQSPLYRSVVKNYVQLLIKLFLRHQWAASSDLSQKDADFKLFMDLLILMEDNYKKHLPVSFYSDDLQVSIKKLNAICKKYGSGSCLHVLHDRLVLEAKKLLVYENRSVKTVMLDLNYKDSAYFNRFFKSKTGISPSAYQRGEVKKYHN